MQTNASWGNQTESKWAKVMKPLRPQVLAVVIAIAFVVYFEGVYDVSSSVITSAITALAGIAGYVIGKDRGD